MLSDKFKKALFSFGLILILTFLVSKTPNSPEGIISNVFVMTIISHFGFLILGTLCFILRVSNFIRRDTFYYLFLGIGNCWLGVLEAALFFLGKVNSFAIEAGLPNLIVGILLLGDSFLVNNSKKQI